MPTDIRSFSLLAICLFAFRLPLYAATLSRLFRASYASIFTFFTLSHMLRYCMMLRRSATRSFVFDMPAYVKKVSPMPTICL